MSGPMKPEQVGAWKAKSFPPQVFEAFNELIAENEVNGRATVLQKDAVKRIKQKMGMLEDDYMGVVFKTEWLNVESAYQEAGWKVSYDKPAYNESYDASFLFKVK